MEKPDNGPSQQPRILVSDPFAAEGLDALRTRARVDVKLGLNEQCLIDELQAGRYEALIVRSETQVTGAVLGASPSLRVVARAGVGVDNIDVAAATRHGVLVINMPTGNIVTTAEHTISLLCALARNLPQANAALRAGRWERSSFVGVELAGKTLGIVGLGRVGSEVARRAVGLAMRVLGFDPYIAPEVAERLGVTLCASLDELLPRADFLTVHTALSDETQGLIDARALAQLPRGARVINCARGGIVDEAALLDALESGHIAGAALDVFVGEPIRDKAHPLIGHPRVVATPHLGAATHEAQVKVAVGTAQAVLAALKGEPVQTAVNAPIARGGAAEASAPYLALAHTLGQLGVQWDAGPLALVRVSLSGDLVGLDLEPIVSETLAGIYSRIIVERVNRVNARLIAEERGLCVEEMRSSDGHGEGYRGAIHVLVRRSNDRFVELVGSVIHDQPHLLSINGYQLHLTLTPGEWLVTRHHDRPGIIGAVGQLLGEANVNIGFMQLGRDEPHGVALMVVGVDSPIPDQVFAQVQALEPIQSARRLRIG